MTNADIFTRLSTDATLTALVPAARIIPTDDERNVPWPFLTYTIQDTAPVLHLGGVASLALYTVRLDIEAETPVQAAEIAAAVRNLLHAKSWTGVRLSLLTSEANEAVDALDEGLKASTTQTYNMWAVES